LLLGGQGAGLYSSLLPETLNHTFTDLGFGWSGYGRASYDLDNPVTDAIFAVGAAMGRDEKISRFDAPPLVTVHPTPAANAPQPGNAFAMQERLLGAKVYDVPTYKARRKVPGQYMIEAQCPRGSTVYLHLPRVFGHARIGDGDWADLTAARRPGKTTSSPMVRLGRVPPSGLVAADLRVIRSSGGLPKEGAVGCLDTAKLKNAVAALRAGGATDVQAGGHSIEATLKPGSTGLAVVAAPWLTGWRCSTDGGKLQEPTDFGGLLAVQLPGATQRIKCSYRPPGLNLGLAAAGGAILVTVLLALASLLRRRRKPAVS
jgi:uncharacterized protein (TIGR03382 family)